MYSPAWIVLVTKKMAAMRPSPRFAGRGSARQNREDPKPPPAKRGKRLSSSAKRDIAWAMKQQPGENTGSIIVHGVKILYTSPMVSTGGASKTSAPGGQTNATAETPLNSRQRRSKKRAEEHFKNFPQGKMFGHTIVSSESSVTVVSVSRMTLCRLRRDVWGTCGAARARSLSFGNELAVRHCAHDSHFHRRYATP